MNSLGKSSLVYQGLFFFVAILGLQPRDKAARHVGGQNDKPVKNLYENGIKFPEESSVFVPDLQHGRRDVKCKAAMSRLKYSLIF